MSVNNKLKNLNQAKSACPDELPVWMLKENAGVLALLVSCVLNASYNEHKLPFAWKRANVIPIPKEKPVRDINCHLRPISLTSIQYKVAEEFIVEMYVAPAILSVIDPAQFGAISRSSITQALISMVHNRAQATDETGTAVRVLLVDYRKAVDLIDHHILAGKILQLPIPTFTRTTGETCNRQLFKLD